MTGAGTVSIRDLLFAVTEAQVFGSLIEDGELRWYIDVKALGRGPDDVVPVWSLHPNTSNRGLAHPKDAPRDLSKLEWHNQSAYDPRTETWIGTFYIHEHESFDHAELLLKPEDSGWTLSWSGDCDIRWDEPYNVAVPFAINTPIEMVDDYVEAADVAMARTRLSEVLDISVFEDAVPLDRQWHFRPRHAS